MNISLASTICSVCWMVLKYNRLFLVNPLKIDPKPILKENAIF